MTRRSNALRLAVAPDPGPGSGHTGQGTQKHRFAPLAPAPRQGLGQPDGPAKPADAVRPVAAPARMRRRHWKLMASFLVLVVVPACALALYLWVHAQDQFASTTGFTVRQEEGASPVDLLGGLSQFTGGGTARDGDILYEFIQSQGLVDRIDRDLDLKSHYARHWPRDWAFSLWPDATAEDLLWHWRRMVQVSYDQTTGLMQVRVLAFDPAFAQLVARQIVAESQTVINALNQQAREDAMRYARTDLEEAVIRLKHAREAMTAFRTRTRIVDPEADLKSRLGVMANLQQQLAEALIDLDLLHDTTLTSDPRVAKARRTIEVIRNRIAVERQTFADSRTDIGAVGQDYPSLIAEYESLLVDREFAEKSYQLALVALDMARSEAARQSRYLAIYIQPTLATRSEYPQRGIVSALGTLFLLLFWAIMALIYYSLRDRR